MYHRLKGRHFDYWLFTKVIQLNDKSYWWWLHLWTAPQRDRSDVCRQTSQVSASVTVAKSDSWSPPIWPTCIHHLVSLFFELTVLLELGTVLIIRRRNNVERNESKEIHRVKNGSIMFADMVSENPRRRFSITDKIDLGTFVVIMSLYLIFNFIFWTEYLIL